MNIIILNIFNNPINVGFQSFLKKVYFYSREHRREKERDGVKHTLDAFCKCLEHRASKPGTRPDPDLWMTFQFAGGHPTNRATWPGWFTLNIIPEEAKTPTSFSQKRFY